VNISEVKIIEEEFEAPDYEQRMEKACELIAQLLFKHYQNKEADKKKRKKLLTIDELAEMLSVSKNTIYAWTHERRIPHVKLGRNVRFNPEKIEAWLKKKEVKVKSYRIE
jgi:excisionase family DNA binding protein